jgi:hypothetical protein
MRSAATWNRALGDLGNGRVAPTAFSQRARQDSNL